MKKNSTLLMIVTATITMTFGAKVQEKTIRLHRNRKSFTTKFSS